MVVGIFLLSAVLISLTLFVNRNKVLNYSLISIFYLLQWSFVIFEYLNRGAVQLGYFSPDALALIFLIILTILSGLAFLYSYIYFNHGDEDPRERSIYFASMVILLVALSAAYLSNQIAITWIFVEITTLSSSALIYHRRNIRTLEATWKYLFICSVSITLVFIGILFLTLAIQAEGIKDLSYKALLSNAAKLNTFWLKLSFLFIFTGFSAKAGLVPMYTAGIDAKDKAPSPAGALFGSVLMNMGFIGIFRMFEIISHTSVFQWANNILLISGLLSVFVSTVYLLKVKNIKRMFAYSSVEHMGLVILAMGCGGIGYYAAILHLILHSFTKASMFFQIDQIYRVYKSKSIYEIGDYFKYNASGSFVLLLGFFMVTAIPPSGMFMSEFMIFMSLFNREHFYLLGFVLLMLTMIMWSLGKNIFKMLFTKPIGFTDTSIERIPAKESVMLFTLLLLVIYLGIAPPVVLVDLINSAIENLPK